MANVRQVLRGWSLCRLPVMPLRLFVRSGAHFAWVRHGGRVEVTNPHLDFSETTKEQQRLPRKRKDIFSERVE